MGAQRNTEVDAESPVGTAVAQVVTKPGMSVKFAMEQQLLKEEDMVITESPAMVNGIKWHMFAVLDGHQGSKCAIHVQQRLWSVIKKGLPNQMPSSWDSPEAALFADTVASAIVSAFDSVDRSWYTQSKPSGTTATVVLLTGRFLTVANVGDSSAYLQTSNGIIEMSSSHRVDSNQYEQDRLIEQNVIPASLAKDLKGPAKPGEEGFGPLRVWPGGLAVSRSIGDADVSPQVVCFPHVKQAFLPDEGARLLIASDGLWDVLPPSRIFRVSRRKRLTKLPAALMTLVCHINGGTVRDDTSIIAVDVLPTHVKDFKTLWKPESVFSRLFSCLHPVTEDHDYTLFSETDSLQKLGVSIQDRLREIWNQGNLSPVSWPGPVDYTVHGPGGKQICR